MPLGRILEIRKKVFTEVKVCCFLLTRCSFKHLMALARNSLILALKSVTKDPCRKFAFLPTARYLPLRAGQASLSCGMYQHAHRFAPYEVQCVVPAEYAEG
jgi:hypothetical protein